MEKTLAYLLLQEEEDEDFLIILRKQKKKKNKIFKARQKFDSHTRYASSSLIIITMITGHFR